MTLNEMFVWILLTSALCSSLGFFLIPKVMLKMQYANRTGIDVNKIEKPEIPEMGGLGAVVAFSLGLSFSLGLLKYFSAVNHVPILVSISVVSLAALIGILDDVSLLGRKEKAWFIAFSSLPLVISQIGNEEIDFLLLTVYFDNESLKLVFWLIVIPFGITCCSNALNMSAGYNGLESGHILIISISLLIVSIINNIDLPFLLILSAMVGSSLSLYIFNKYPSRTFVGDVGTLSFGALVSSIVIMTNQIVFGIVCLIPTYYELYATIKYKIKGIERRKYCMNPIVGEDKIISVPKGAEDFTLAYRILSLAKLSERKVVNLILSFYALCGTLAIMLSLLTK